MSISPMDLATYYGVDDIPAALAYSGEVEQPFRPT